MAKTLKSFFPHQIDPGNRDMKDTEGSSIIFQLWGGDYTSADQQPGYCYCTGGTCYNPTGYDSDIPRYYWTVPAGITKATFEAWGMGGYGAGATCCMQGVPGGSGAYALKTIDVVAGDIYTMCLGDVIDNGAQTTYASTCANTIQNSDPASNPDLVNHGIRGAKAYVTGNGLTNFCAEGGNPGVTRPYGYNGSCACRMPGGGDQAFHCFVPLTMCDITRRSVGDSDNDRYQRACYYGADYGSRGQWGYAQSNYCSNTCSTVAAICGTRLWRHYPGRQLDHWHGWSAPLEGGWIAEWVCAQNMNATSARSNRRAHTATPYARGCANTPNLIGVGGMSSTVEGGNIMCGGMGGPNQIRITYKQRVEKMSRIKNTFTYKIPDGYVEQTSVNDSSATFTYRGPQYLGIAVDKNNNVSGGAREETSESFLTQRPGDPVVISAYDHPLEAAILWGQLGVDSSDQDSSAYPHLTVNLPDGDDNHVYKAPWPPLPWKAYESTMQYDTNTGVFSGLTWHKPWANWGGIGGQAAALRARSDEEVARITALGSDATDADTAKKDAWLAMNTEIDNKINVYQAAGLKPHQVVWTRTPDWEAPATPIEDSDA